MPNDALAAEDLRPYIVWHLLPDDLTKHLQTAFDLAGSDLRRAQSFMSDTGDTLQNSVEDCLLEGALTEDPPARTAIFSEARDRYAKLFMGSRELIDRGHAGLAIDILSRSLPLLGPLLFDQKRHRLIAVNSLGLLACALDDLSEYESALILYTAALNLINSEESVS